MNSKKHPPLIEIRTIFPSATGVGILLPEIGKGLVVQFNRQANLFDELEIRNPSKNIFNCGLFELANKFGFVTLKNCSVPIHKNFSRLSRGRSSEECFIQDPFHRDRLPCFVEFTTVMFKNSADKRDEGTYYAREQDVRDAINQLIKKGGLSSEIIDALQEMVSPSYSFMLYNEQDMPARDIIQNLFPDFTQAVFDIIPSNLKYVQKWTSDEWNISIHSNTGDMLHGRPTGRHLLGKEKPENKIIGMEIYRGYSIDT